MLSGSELWKRKKKICISFDLCIVSIEKESSQRKYVDVVRILIKFVKITLFVFGATTPQWARASSFTRFLDHSQRCTTVGRNPVDE